MMLKIIKKVTRIISLEAIVRLSARLTADIVYFGVTHSSHLTDSGFVLGVTAVVKISNKAAKKYKRTNLDPTSIFERFT